MSTFDVDAFAPPLSIPRLASPPVLLPALHGVGPRHGAPGLERPAHPLHHVGAPDLHDDAGRAFIERQHDRAAQGDGYSFVIAEEADPTSGIGSIGLWLQEIESGRASIGYWLVAGARGRGLAADTLRAVVEFAFGELAIPRLHLFVEPWNTASARTAQAGGFGREATLRGWERIDDEQRDADCFALLYDEWLRLG